MWLLPPLQAPNKGGGGGYAKDAAGGSQTLDLPGCRVYLASSRGMVTTTVSNSNNNYGGWESQVGGKVRWVGKSGGWESQSTEPGRNP